MNESRALKNILLLSGLLGVLVLAFVLDLVITTLAERNAQLGGLDTTLVWIYPMLQLLWMLGIVGLIWLMVSGGGYSRWVSVVFLLVGLLLLYINPILFVNELPDSWYNRPISDTRFPAVPGWGCGCRVWIGIAVLLER
jgi:hypothetical protein